MERPDRGCGKSRSPLRSISSPPAVFSHIYESQLGASPGGAEGGAGTQLEIPRGQMWPGAEPQQQQQQTQHTRLKKKLEDLKKRHVQDKEGWTREKESLLREVADIQQVAVVTPLPLYPLFHTVTHRVSTSMRSWFLGKDVHACMDGGRYPSAPSGGCGGKSQRQRKKKLEDREGAGLMSGAAQSAADPSSAASQSGLRQRGETPTLRREREEQRRLLADTHSTAMDLRCRIEHNERDWSREKAELLDRFDVERREWERQLKDMQRKIEELYCDVRTKRDVQGSGRQGVNEDVHRLSVRSTSTGSSLLSDNEPLSSGSSQSPPVGHPPFPGFGPNADIWGSDFIGRDGHRSSFLPADGLCGYDVGGPTIQEDRSNRELAKELSSTWQQDSAPDGKEATGALERPAMFHGAPGCVVPQKNVSDCEQNIIHVHPEASDKKNTTALNAALKEIARASEELCSYQDEIKKKSVDKRNRTEAPSLSEEKGMLFGHDKTWLEVNHAPCDLSQIYDDLRALEKENWSPENTWRADRESIKSSTANAADPESRRETKTSPGLVSESDAACPPVPPRSSSCNLSSSLYPDTELYIPESPVTTVGKCHSPCVLVEKICSSPSIVRKFEAMLQVNEGKVLMDGVLASGAVPANSECVNRGSCHNRWSCDASKFTSSKLSTYGTVQKSFSEVNILTAAKGLRSDYCPGVGSRKSPELQIPQIVKELPLDLLLSSLEIPPAGSNLQGSRRNIMLEQKTAEFNRTLFQCEMGHGVEKQDGSTASDACPAETTPPRETAPRPLHTDVTTRVLDVYPDITLSLPPSNSTIRNPEVQSRRMRCGAEGQEVGMKQGIPSDPPSGQQQIGLKETTHRCEVKHKVQTAGSTSRKAQHRAAADAPFPEPVLPADAQPGPRRVDDDGSCSEKGNNPRGAKWARVGVSHRQPSAEHKQRQQAELGHESVPPPQSESARPGPRMMMMMMNEHPWKALTLAAYPRPEGSRSNYGAVERILKNYESAARALQNQSLPNQMDSSPDDSSGGQEGNVTVPHMPGIDPLALPPTLRHAQTSNSSQKHSTHAQFSRHSAAGGKEVHLTVQKNHVASVSPLLQKNFSRPARPANRRLPTRWATRSPTPSSSTSSSSSSPTAPPVVASSFGLRKHSSSFTYSHAFHIKTVII
uniref:MTCL family member 3a n=2 Tax=Gasterosteus aculeatus aculeatus TaxID=481459 RepID=A0AAQ4Q2V7_GASAC